MRRKGWISVEASFQGFLNASREFEASYDRGVSKFVKRMSGTEPGSQLISRHPFDNTPCYMGLTCFADDLTTRTFDTTNRASAIALRSKVSGKWLGDALGEDGYVLNPDKKESLVVPAGKGCKQLTKQIFGKKATKDTCASGYQRHVPTHRRLVGCRYT